jgi:transcription initiation factor TFIIB
VERMEIGIYICPECGSDRIIYLPQKGDSVCHDCGLVVEEKLPVDSRKGGPVDSYGPLQNLLYSTLYKGSTFGSAGVSKFRDANQKYLPPGDRAKFRRLIKIHTSRGKHSTTLALAWFRNTIGRLDIPDHIEKEASKILLKALKKKLTRGRSYEESVGAAVLIAYRINEQSISVKALSKRIPVSRERIIKCSQLFLRELRIKKAKYNLEPEDLITKFCHEAQVSIEIEKRAIRIIKDFKNKVSISGKDPNGIAIGAIYLASRMQHKINPRQLKKITQEELSSIGGVTEVTLRARYREMKEKLLIN